MSYEEPIEHLENDVLTVSVFKADSNYVLWQKGLAPEAGSEDGVYFEYNDQINGGYNSISACSISAEGIEVSLSNGKGTYLRFPTGFDKLSELKAGLTKIYRDTECPVEFCI